MMGPAWHVPVFEKVAPLKPRAQLSGGPQSASVRQVFPTTGFDGFATACVVGAAVATVVGAVVATVVGAVIADGTVFALGAALALGADVARGISGEGDVAVAGGGGSSTAAGVSGSLHPPRIARLTRTSVGIREEVHMTESIPSRSEDRT
jgi:hypothetical protein